MAQDSLFDQDRCPVPFIPDVDFRFVSDCDILPAPPAIFDCPPVELPLDPPPQAIPCPDLDVTAVGSLGYGSSPCLPPRFDVAVTTTKVDSCGSCLLTVDFDFDLEIPPPIIPCPVFTADGTVTVGTGSACSNAGPGVVVTITKTPQSSISSCGSATPCEYSFDFDFNIPVPCPVIYGSAGISVTNPVAGCAGPATVDLLISRRPQSTASCGSVQPCEFDFDFDFNIPVPQAPCPVLNANASLAVTAGNCVTTPAVNITVTNTTSAGSCGSASACTFDFDFDFVIPVPDPPCPIFTGSATLDARRGTVPAVNLVITNTTASRSSCSDAQTCTFDFDFDFVLPQPPCPIIDATGSLTLHTGSAACTQPPGVAVQVTKDTVISSSSSVCAFTFDFDFNIPIPPPPCPQFSANTNTTVTNSAAGGAGCGGVPTADVNVAVVTTQSGSSCNPVCLVDFDFDFDFNIPPPIVPCPTVNGSISVSTGYLYTYVYYSSSSFSSIDIQCGGLPQVAADLLITPTQAGDSCNPSCLLDFDFNFDFMFPKVPVPCPTMQGTADATATTTTGDPEANVTLLIAQNQTGDPCQPTCEVTFDFDFDFKLPTGGGGGGPTVMFNIVSADCDDVPYKSAVASIVGRDCGVTSAPLENAGQITLYDVQGCNLNEPEGDLTGRKGWARYMSISTTNSVSASYQSVNSLSSIFHPGTTENATDCMWVIMNMCCDEDACGW